jgi:hypothetical protein
VVVSADARGMIEYWDADSLSAPEAPIVNFKFKSDTDLYDLAKSRVLPCSVVISPRCNLFVVTSTDKQIRLFDFCSGKLRRKYDESVRAYQVPVPGATVLIPLIGESPYLLLDLSRLRRGRLWRAAWMRWTWAAEWRWRESSSPCQRSSLCAK